MLANKKNNYGNAIASYDTTGAAIASLVTIPANTFEFNLEFTFEEFFPYLF